MFISISHIQSLYDNLHWLVEVIPFSNCFSSCLLRVSSSLSDWVSKLSSPMVHHLTLVSYFHILSFNPQGLVLNV